MIAFAIRIQLGPVKLQAGQEYFAAFARQLPQRTMSYLEQLGQRNFACPLSLITFFLHEIQDTSAIELLKQGFIYKDYSTENENIVKNTQN